MSPKQCPACRKIFLSWEKWNAHVTVSPCARKRQALIHAREETIMRDIEAGKRNFSGKRIRRH